MKHLPLVHLLLLSLLLLVLAGCGNNAPVPPPPDNPPPTSPPPTSPPPTTPPPTNPPPTNPPPTNPPPTNPPPSEGGISGTVFAPAGGDVAGTLIGACAVVNQGFDCSAPSTVTVSVTQAGPSAPYTLAAPAGDYVVVAQQDANGDGAIDYDGGYGYDPARDAYQIVTSPAQGIDITLQAVGGTDPTPPPPPPAEDGISGTVFAPSGGDVAGAEVLACPVVNNAFDCSTATPVAITQSGPSAPYTMTGLAPGQYVVGARQDVDGDGTFDYLGGYGYDPATDSFTQVVTPPAQGIDITLLPLGGGTSGADSQLRRMFADPPF